ncbi:H-2 class I histocompatibility antigen, Q9 alpha chain-like [Astyanax mexicanus]|uniref:H-2 class I histocompatibility antigen, Q9 alpha chain-like n=1 Tax=Astyanax mexicanus TaxID=7994 RepID=UPI0020CB1C0D|nr:H-2 class I histocompatibility antigen, Q9 alpha chain-like [Astyanax mexicanus]
MEQIMKSLVFLAFSLQLSSAVTHSHQYVYTAVTPGINFPEFTIVGMVDGQQINYYDSNIKRMIPGSDWVKKDGAVDPDFWNRNTQLAQGTQESFKVGVQTLMQRFNQSKGVHTVQIMYGCELDDDGTKRGYRQDGYDGEDFVSLDLDTETWTAPTPQAVITKHKWDADVVFTKGRKNYLLNTCIDWLNKYVGYGRDTLERKVRPEVSVFQKDSSSPVVCHATGFFPKAVMISWQKNGEELHGDQDLRETTPNEDGTFQKRSILTIPPKELDSDEYTCVIQHSSLEKEMVLKVSDRRVLSGVPVGVIIGAVVAVLLLVVIGCAGVFIWKKKTGFKPVSQNPSEADSSSNNSSK